MTRESDIAAAFVSLATSLATGYDVTDLLSELTTDSARFLDVASAGLLLADGLGVLHVLSASSEATRQLEIFQLQNGQGPCRDCFDSGVPVSVPDLAVEVERWPLFVPAARAAGFESVHALPMRLRDTVLGAMGLFGTTVGSLEPADLKLGQAFADVASVALVQDRTVADRVTLMEQLQTALTSRVLVEQAKGVVAQVGDVDMPRAFLMLRQYGRRHRLRLGDVAHAVVTRSLPAQRLLEDANVGDSHSD